nr:MAG TPA: hypothetical protein [Caudoviricetes sp.]
MNALKVFVKQEITNPFGISIYLKDIYLQLRHIYQEIKD